VMPRLSDGKRPIFERNPISQRVRTELDLRDINTNANLEYHLHAQCVLELRKQESEIDNEHRIWLAHRGLCTCHDWDHHHKQLATAPGTVWHDSVSGLRVRTYH
jgi:hypothetical protein